MRRRLPALDCLPLDGPARTTLSDAQLRAAESLQRVLLTPHDHGGVDAWRAAVNDEARSATGGDMAMFQLMLPEIEPHYSRELCTSSLADYPEHMQGLERRMGAFRRALSLGAGNRYMLWLEHLEWYYGSAYYNEWVTGLRAFDCLFAAVPCRGSRYPAMLHVYHDRPGGGPRFDASQVRLMQLVRPALEAGVRAVSRSLGNRATFVASLDAREDGALVLDASGALLHQNPAVARLVPLERDQSAVLAAAAEMARGLFSPDDRIRFDPDTARRAVSTGPELLLVSAVLIGEGVLDTGPVALVTLHANEIGGPDADTLRDRFGLTPRQAEVARLLARRLSNDEIAQRLCVSPNTARNHTEAVMGKLDVTDRRAVGDRLSGRS